MGKKVSTKASSKGVRTAANTTPQQRSAMNVTRVPGATAVTRTGGREDLIDTGKSRSSQKKAEAAYGLSGKKAQRKARGY